MPQETLKPCSECKRNPCECRNGCLIMGDGFNTGIPGGLDMDMSTPF